MPISPQQVVDALQSPPGPPKSAEGIQDALKALLGRDVALNEAMGAINEAIAADAIEGKDPYTVAP